MSRESDRLTVTDAAASLTAATILSPVHALLTFCAPNIASRVLPGQFVHVRVSPSGISPLLRRPFSVAGVNMAHGTFRLLVRTIGRGTEILANLVPGTQLAALGPLGRPFPEVSNGRSVVAVAGGVGVAPLLFLATRRGGAGLTILYGAGSADGLVLADDLAESCDRLALATDDGSEGYHGFVTDLLPQTLDELDRPVVLACGPRPMMQAAAACCRGRQVECYASFEAWLGCGIGACLGCVIPAAGEPRRYIRVCRDGPVFNAEEVDWDALQ